MAEQSKQRGFLFWILVLVGTAVVLFVGSAMVAGIMESNERDDVKKKAEQLSPIGDLQKMVLSGIHEKGDVPLVCWYIGAIGFRLAEARDLNIPKEYAIDLANDKYLVEELVKTGLNPKSEVAGYASQVYDSPLSQKSTFDAQAEACSRFRR